MEERLSKLHHHFLDLFWDEKQNGIRINLTLDDFGFLHYGCTQIDYWEEKYCDHMMNILAALEESGLVQFHEVMHEGKDHSYWSVTWQGQKEIRKRHTIAKNWLQGIISRQPEFLIVAVVIFCGGFAPYGLYRLISELFQ